MGLLDLPTEATRAVEPRVPQRAVTGDLGEPMRNRLMASAGGLAGDRRRLVTILVERRVASRSDKGDKKKKARAMSSAPALTARSGRVLDG